ncbi:MAG: phage tail length tape measure family protein [Rhizobiales bacterium]|nr:phage tail length tape measure family protein [Hyphomicrobiales bacterium]MBI3674756.1 phage tail length tape measure family protein [Hyphomicrobiales bacterium]
MTDRNVSIRIGVTGKEDAKRAFDEVGKAGQDAFVKTTAAIDAAGAATDRETQRLQRLAQAARQAAGADDAQRKFNTFMGVGASGAGSARDSASVFIASAKATEELEARTKALRAQIDPLGAAQGRLNTEIAEAASLFKAGTITQAEHAAAVALAQRNYQFAADAIKKYGGDAALTTNQVAILGSAARHTIDAIIAGQNPLRALSVEGIKVSAALGEGGLSGLLAGVGRGILGLVAPATLLAGGLVAVGGAALYAYDSYITSQKALEVATAGVGRAAGATVDQLNRIADSASEAGRVSVAAARGMEIAFLRTGRIGVDQFGDLVAAAKNYAATTAEDIDAAAKELASAFADPAKGVDLLNAKVGGYDDRTRQLIRTLAAQNDLTGAQKLLLDNLKPSLIDAAETTTALGRAWEFVAQKASNAMDAIGWAIDGATDPTLQQRLGDLLKERQTAATSGGTYSSFAGMVGFSPSRPLADIDADIANVKKQIAALEQKATDAKADALAARTSAVAGDMARNLTPGFNDFQALKEQQAALNAALADAAARQKVADLKQVEAAYDAVTRALTTYLDPAEKARRLDELEVRALNARTPAQKAEIAEERKRLELSGQTVTTATAQAEITRAGTRARADATKSITDQSQALTLNARTSLDVADAYLKGADAAQVVEARRKALTESLGDGVDIETRMRQLLAEQVAETAMQSAKSVSDLGAQADAQKGLNDAIASGALTAAQVQRQMQVEQALRPLLVAQALAEGDAKVTLGRIIDALRGAYGRLNAEQSRSAALGQIETQRNQIDLLQRQIDLAGRSESLGAIELAQLQAKQQLLQQGVDLGSQEARTVIENAAAIEQLNQSLALARSSMQELQSLTDTAFGHFADLIAQGNTDWKSWADAGRAAILDINRELVKLALLNPLKNLLFGANLPTLSSVGDIFSSIFGGTGASLYHQGGMAGESGATRQVPFELFRSAPRFHGGGFLSPDEVPAILQRGERVLNRDETRAYNRGTRGGNTVVNVTIQTPTPAAFQASRTQIAADLSRAVQMGSRGR